MTDGAPCDDEVKVLTVSHGDPPVVCLYLLSAALYAY